MLSVLIADVSGLVPTSEKLDYGFEFWSFSMLNHILTAEMCDRLATVLLHSLWQGASLAVLVWCALRVLPGQSARLRYFCCSAGLLGVVLAAFASWSWLAPESSAADGRPAAPVAAARDHDSHDVARRAGEIEAATRGSAVSVRPRSGERGSREAGVSTEAAGAWSSYLVLGWGIGAIAMLFRVARTARACGRLMATHVDVDVERQTEIAAIVASLCERLRIRHAVRLVVSLEVDSPGVVGIVWPTLLIPAAMVTGVPVEEWRVILAHELAHMRRHDYLVNLLQMLVEAALFFNPAVWWISRQMRIEREACCDRVAAELAGQPLEVARTLVRVAERLQSGSVVNAAPVPAVAMAGDGQPGSLFDRVRRLATPGERPSVATPWLSLLGFAIVATAVFAGLQQGTDLAVQAAKEALSPAERVQQIVELSERHGELARKEAAADPFNDLLDPALSEKVELSGTVRMADGSPVPARTAVFSITSTRVTENSSRSTTGLGASTREAVDVFEWSGTVNRGLTVLYVKLPHEFEDRFAPATIAPIPAASPEKVSGLDLVVGEGFTGQLRVLDTDGNPLPGVELKSYFRVGTERSAAILRPQTLMTDSDGLITIPHVTDAAALEVDARVSGFEIAHDRITLEHDATVEWRLTPTEPFEAVVVADKTNEPVGGARVHLIEEELQSPGTHHTRNFEDPRDAWSGDKDLAAETDDNGVFRLTSLKNAPTYTVWVEADGFAPQLVTGIRAGEKNITVRLKPEIVIAGRITGNLDSLSTWHHVKGKKGKYFAYRNPLPSYDDILRADVEIRDGVGYFRLKRLLAGRPLRLFFKDRALKFDVTESVTDIEINLDEPPESVADAVLETDAPQGATRRLIVKLTGDRDDAPVRGDIQIAYVRHDGRHYSPTFPIEDGQIAVDIEVPTRLSVIPRRLIGYWAEKPRTIEVAESDEPLEITVPLRPAGAIRGIVHAADGSLSNDFRARLHVVEMPPGMDSHLRHDIRTEPPKSSRGEFLFTSLPIGGTYAVVVREHGVNTMAAASIEPFVLEPDEPVRTFNLRFRDGADYSGRVLGAAGEIVPGAAVRVHHKVGDSGTSISGYSADETGTVELVDARTDAPHEYTLEFYAPGHVSQSHKVEDWNKVPREVRLVRGQRLSVRLIHAETGEPFKNRYMHTLPEGEFTSRSWPSGRTDDHGRISFDTFEAIEYSLRIHGVILKSLTVEAGDSAGARLHSEFAGNEPLIRFVAGQATEITVKAMPEP